MSNKQTNMFDAHFDGKTYDPQKDKKRLKSQLQCVFDLMSDGQPRTLQRISRSTGFPEASISARIRDFRKKKFGSHTVESYREGNKWLYKLIVNEIQNPS